MARKKQPKKARQAEPEPPPRRATEEKRHLEILLDWRFNLVVLLLMESLLVAFFLPRETRRHREKVGRKALLSGNYKRADDYYRALNRKDGGNPVYLKALGDVALARRQPTTALSYYVSAGKAGGAPGLDIQRALAYHQLALTTADPQRREEAQKEAARFFRRAYSATPRDMKVSYARGQMALASLDLVEAAEYFSRVRPDVLPPGWSPDEEQERLIKEARTHLDQIARTVLEGGDYALNLEGLKIQPPPEPTPPPAPEPVDLTTAPPTLSQPAMPTTPVARPTATPPAANRPTTADVPATPTSPAK